jgi:hypothetical protein
MAHFYHPRRSFTTVFWDGELVLNISKHEATSWVSFICTTLRYELHSQIFRSFVSVI